MILRANSHPACDSRIRKSAHPDPTPAKEVYFPFSASPSPPSGRQDLHRAPAGRPPPRRAPGELRGSERRGTPGRHARTQAWPARWAELDSRIPSKLGFPMWPLRSCLTSAWHSVLSKGLPVLPRAKRSPCARRPRGEFSGRRAGDSSSNWGVHWGRGARAGGFSLQPNEEGGRG